MPEDPRLKAAGAEADKLLKPKVDVPIWVLVAVAVFANLAGVILHV